MGSGSNFHIKTCLVELICLVIKEETVKDSKKTECCKTPYGINYFIVVSRESLKIIEFISP